MNSLSAENLCVIVYRSITYDQDAVALIEHNQKPRYLTKLKRGVFTCCGSRGLVYGFREPKRIVQIRSLRKGELHQGGQMFHTEACSTKFQCLSSRSNSIDSSKTHRVLDIEIKTVKLPGSKTITPTNHPSNHPTNLPINNASTYDTTANNATANTAVHDLTNSDSDEGPHSAPQMPDTSTTSLS